MIKGINRSIIEVCETGNEYYERAILIVKPEYASVQRAILEEEARKMVRELDVPSAFRSGHSRLRSLLLLLAAAASGSGITLLLSCVVQG